MASDFLGVTSSHGPRVCTEQLNFLDGSGQKPHRVCHPLTQCSAMPSASPVCSARTRPHAPRAASLPEATGREALSMDARGSRPGDILGALGGGKAGGWGRKDAVNPTGTAQTVRCETCVLACPAASLTHRCTRSSREGGASLYADTRGLSVSPASSETCLEGQVVNSGSRPARPLRAARPSPRTTASRLPSCVQPRTGQGSPAGPGTGFWPDGGQHGHGGCRFGGSVTGRRGDREIDSAWNRSGPLPAQVACRWVPRHTCHPQSRVTGANQDV